MHRPDAAWRRKPRACHRQAGQADFRRPARARRICAIDESAGETLRPNPNSAVVWRYTGVDANGNGKLDFEETMHRSISMAVIRDGLLVIPDLQGVVHCLDAKTGKVHWTQDLMAEIWGSPCVVDGKIYLGDRDGDVRSLRAFAEAKPIGQERDGRPGQQHAGRGRQHALYRHHHASDRGWAAANATVTGGAGILVCRTSYAWRQTRMSAPLSDK